MMSNSSLARAPFEEQLRELTSMSLPTLAAIPTTAIATSERVSLVEEAADQVLQYFSTGRSVLNGLDAHDDVEWMFEGRQAVVDVGQTIMRAGDVMEHLMTALELCRESNDNEEVVDGTTFYNVVQKIEVSITEWHDILGLVRDLRSQIDIASEWKDFHDQILTDVQGEIDNCYTVMFEIEEQRHLASEDQPDLDVLTSVMDESPFLGHAKLPNMNDVERQLNHKFVEVATRMKPLSASLEFIPLRLEQYTAKAKNLFPSSIEALENKYKELNKRWVALNNDVSILEKELGEDRWLNIFRNTGNQAEEMLDNYEENVKILKEEESKPTPDIHKIERYQTQNAYLVPAITRIVALFDRALKDRLTLNGEMYSKQAKLHKRWAALDDQYDRPVSMTHSPLVGKREDTRTNSIASSMSLSSSHTSPYSSLHSSPTMSSVKPINSKLKPEKKRTRTTLEGSVEINPIRGLSSKRTGSCSSSSSSGSTFNNNTSSAQATATIHDCAPKELQSECQSQAQTQPQPQSQPEPEPQTKSPQPQQEPESQPAAQLPAITTTPVSSRLSLLPVPMDSPRPMYHAKPLEIPEPSFKANSTMRKSSMPHLRPTRTSDISSRSPQTPGLEIPATPSRGRRQSEEAHCMTPRPRCSSRIGDEQSRLPRPSSRQSGSYTPLGKRSRSQLGYLQTPSTVSNNYNNHPRKASMPAGGMLTKRASASALRRDGALKMAQATPSRTPRPAAATPKPGTATALGTYSSRISNQSRPWRRG